MARTAVMPVLLAVDAEIVPKVAWQEPVVSSGIILVIELVVYHEVLLVTGNLVDLDLIAFIVLAFGFDENMSPILVIAFIPQIYYLAVVLLPKAVHILMQARRLVVCITDNFFLAK